MYSTGERQEVIQYLDKTRDDLTSAVAELSEAQLNFKASPERWSIAGIVEHIAMVEDVVAAKILQQIASAPPALADGDVKQADLLLLRKVVDRSVKREAPEEFRPTGKPSAISLEEFLTGRKKIVDFVRSVPHDLRQISIPHRVFGPLDGHQRLLALAGHCARHTEQIIETKADPNFPA